jgi:hypothetical protein
VGDKIDLKKRFKELYQPPREPVMVDVPELAFLMVDGEGYPETSQRFQDAMGALYGVAYTLKFALKGEGLDFTVMPLEALWWAEDMDAFLDGGDKDDWIWTAMIAQPDEVAPEHVEAAREAVGRKQVKKGEPANPALPDLRLERWTEGPAAQVMHLGPYGEEGPTIRALHDFIAAESYVRSGKHHEIYLGDPRRAKPENLKTVIRQPVARA